MTGLTKEEIERALSEVEPSDRLWIEKNRQFDQAKADMIKWLNKYYRERRALDEQKRREREEKRNAKTATT